MIGFEKGSLDGRLRVLWGLACALLLLSTGCDAPTSVGEDLIEGEQGEPTRVSIPLGVESVAYVPVTSGPAAGRVLAGQTTDDPLGDVTARGYLDFNRNSASTPDDIGSLTLDSVQVLLQTDYRYGDPTETLSLALYDLQEEWVTDNTRADTSLSDIVAGSPVTTFEISPDDTLKTITLPETWVRDHAGDFTTVGDSAFAEAFHGFEIRHESGNRIVGFDLENSSVRAVFEPVGGEAEEATLSVARQLTTIRQPNPQRPNDWFVVQEGTGRGLQFAFDLPDSLRNAAVNRATLVFEVDSLQDGFRLPRTQQLVVYDYNATADSLNLVLSGTTPASLSLTSPPTRFSTPNFPLSTLVQNELFGLESIEFVQLRPGAPVRLIDGLRGTEGVTANSLDAALIRSDPGPYLELTYTSTDE